MVTMTPKKRYMTPTPRTTSVERIVTPMKMKPKTLNPKRRMGSDSGYEGSSPLTAHQYFLSFVKLKEHFRGKIKIKQANKDIKEISALAMIPGPADLEKIKDAKVGQSSCLSRVLPLTSLQLKKDIKKSSQLVLKYIESRKELQLEEFCWKLEEWEEVLSA